MDNIMDTTAGFDGADLDAAWADEGDTVGAADEAQTPLENQQGGEQQPENPPAATDTNTDPAGRGGGQNQPAQQQENPPELFTIQFNGKTEQVTRQQLITMAQKGRDYDNVRAERDQLRQYRSEADPALGLVREYARRNGMDVPTYLDFCRKQELMAGGMSEQAAAEKLGLEKERAELDARQAELDEHSRRQDSVLQRARRQQEERRRDMDAFLRAYPDVKAESIPREVWTRVAAGTPLLSAYTMHENGRLQAELAAERQNRANRERSPGALGGNAGAELDELDRIWAEED